MSLDRTSQTSNVLSSDEAAAYLKISVKTLLKMANAGQIPAKRAGSLWRFSALALERWIHDDALAA